MKPYHVFESMEWEAVQMSSKKSIRFQNVILDLNKKERLMIF